MATDREPFEDALRRVRHAVEAVYLGDHRLFAEVWSHTPDVSLFGAFGPAKVGWDDVGAVLPWVADRYRDGTVEIDYVVVSEHADTGFTVGYERAEVSIDRQPVAASTIRITHIFRYEQGFRDERGGWALIHRHGDFEPLDDSPNVG